jgi:RNA polymerase sigma-70 factor (ECF subfamily)
VLKEQQVGEEAPDVERLCERYGPMVYRRCLRLLRDQDAAMDACQDVFVRVLERRDRLDARHPSSLLYRIATNLCLNRIRDRRRRADSGSDEPLERIASAEDGERATGARLLLDRLFGRQPESSRTIAVLHYLDGLTLEQVAEAVGLSVSGVRRRLRVLRHVVDGMEES